MFFMFSFPQKDLLNAAGSIPAWLSKGYGNDARFVDKAYVFRSETQPLDASRYGLRLKILYFGTS